MTITLTTLSDRVSDLVFQKGRGGAGITLADLIQRLGDVPEEEIRREVICALTTSKASKPPFKARYNVINDKIRLWQKDFEPKAEFYGGSQLPCRIYSPFIVAIDGEPHIGRTLEEAVSQAGPAGITF